MDSSMKCNTQKSPRYFLPWAFLLLVFCLTCTIQITANHDLQFASGGATVAATGGTGLNIQQGAATALDADRYNRQLHPTEMAWIRSHAHAFAQSIGIDDDEVAEQRLAQQALRDVDAAWQGYLGSTTDKAAQRYLQGLGGQSTFTADDGEQQALFSVRNGEQYNAAQYASDIMYTPGGLEWYQRYVQPGIVHTSSVGVYGATAWGGVKHIGSALPGMAADLWESVKSLPDNVAYNWNHSSDVGDEVWHGVKEDVAEGFVSAGHGLGGAGAMLSDRDTASQLRALYGQDNAPRMAAPIASGQGVLMVVPGGKLVGAATKPLVSGVRKGVQGARIILGKVPPIFSRRVPLELDAPPLYSVTYSVSMDGPAGKWLLPEQVSYKAPQVISEGKAGARATYGLTGSALETSGGAAGVAGNIIGHEAGEASQVARELGREIGSSSAGANHRNRLSGISGLDRYVPESEFISNSDIPASSVNAARALNAKLSRLENAQKNAVRTEILDDGRVIYYSAEKLSSKPGPTRGAALVTEYNPSSGRVRVYYESYDHKGEPVRVHPKFING